MGTAMFYHLTRRSLVETLPVLLERSIERGWRVVVRGPDPERMRWLDQKLWLDPAEGFLPHGLSGGPNDADQPVLLVTGDQPAADAQCLMAIDGAHVAPEEVAKVERLCILFDGHNMEAVQHARGQWKALTGAGVKAQYWSEESGRWEMKAEA